MTVLTTDRVLVDGKTVLQCWFPRTVELFDEERHRLETWRTGAAYHRSTDRGRENCLQRIKEHNSRVVIWKHVPCMNFEKIDSTIDKELENEIRKEASFWKMVLERLIDVMLIPEKNYLALRGQPENLNEEVEAARFEFIRMNDRVCARWTVLCLQNLLLILIPSIHLASNAGICCQISLANRTPLQKLHATRCSSRVNTAVKLRYFDIIKALSEIILKSSSKDERSLAENIKTKILNFEFV
ncbi:hypothetical protein EVAR_56686_1 [Eumeta japonica]|uniref:Uncharacterized protein n=1 Tax=Eumeta variegata TaxID=151549 RepID=A0A4C2A4Q4_EUMVA|nr:hypothetical protein EVAR_56686_1 [Eumeta japonica]